MMDTDNCRVHLKVTQNEGIAVFTLDMSKKEHIPNISRSMNSSVYSIQMLIMRKLAVSIVATIVCCYTLTAQYQLLNTEESSIRGDISLIDDAFSVSSVNNAGNIIVQEVSVQLSGGELIFDILLRGGEESDNYMLDMRATLDGQPIDIMRSDLYGPLGDELPAQGGLRYQVIWTNLHERYIDLSGELTLTITAQRYGVPRLPYGLECGVPPAFTKKQRLPYYLAAGVGLASIGSSIIFKGKSNDTYDNEYLTRNFAEQAEPFYQSANSDHQKSLVMRYAGIGILAVDAGLYIYRLIRLRKKEEAYREFCREDASTTVTPLVELPNATLKDGQLGLSFTYRF